MNQQPIYITRRTYNRLTFWQRVFFWLAAGFSGQYVHISDVLQVRRKGRGR